MTRPQKRQITSSEQKQMDITHLNDITKTPSLINLPRYIFSKYKRQMNAFGFTLNEVR